MNAFFTKGLRAAAIGVFSLCILFFGYIANRENFSFNLICYTLAFSAFIYLYKSPQDFKSLIYVAIIARFALLISTPLLSDDYFRFIWDGQLIINKINPYLYTPGELINNTTIQFPLKGYLLDNLNALQQSNYTCYTPLNQILFFLAALISPNNVLGQIVIMRLIIILAEIGTIYFGLKLLTHYSLDRKNIILYALNPLVIIELTGNLHFEGLMLFLMMASLYYYTQKKIALSGLFASLSVAFKLITVITVPAVLFRLKFKDWAKYAVSGTLAGGVLLAPLFILPGSRGFVDSVMLFVRTFEFNASGYYLLRSLGYAYKGYNLIQVIGPLLTALSLSTIIIYSFVKRNKGGLSLYSSIVLAYTLFYLLSTTVHPWYITPLIAFSVFSSFWFPVIWSLLIFLSYAAYSNPEFKENGILLLIEYVVLFIFILRESWIKKVNSQNKAIF